MAERLRKRHQDEVRTKIREEKVRIQSQPKAENLDDGLSGEDSPAPDPDPEDEDVVVDVTFEPSIPCTVRLEWIFE